jgi:hypothetical protein
MRKKITDALTAVNMYRIFVYQITSQLRSAHWAQSPQEPIAARNTYMAIATPLQRLSVDWQDTEG